MKLGDAEWLRKERAWLVEDIEHHAEAVNIFQDLYNMTQKVGYEETVMFEAEKLNEARALLKELRGNSVRYIEKKKDRLARP